MNRRNFLKSVAVGMAALYLLTRPESVRGIPAIKGFEWECRGWNSTDFMVYNAPTNPPEMPELLTLDCWRSVTMKTLWN